VTAPGRRRCRRPVAVASLVGAVGVTVALVLIGAQVATRPMLITQFAASLGGVERLGTDGVVRQQTDRDCGVAALATVLTHFGRPVDIERLTALLNPGAEGVSMLDLQRGAERLGLGATGWRLTPAQLGAGPLPAIVLIDGHHWVVVTGVEADGAVLISDPARGRLRMRADAFARRWQGYALRFEGPPTDRTE